MAWNSPQPAAVKMNPAVKVIDFMTGVRYLYIA